MRRGFGSGMAAGAVATLLVLVLIGLIVVYAGWYNVAASAGHTVFGRWLFTTTMENSVRSRADDVGRPPARFDLAEGGKEFRGMCESCHGGPGVKRMEAAELMVPKPPELSEEAEEWELPEVFWIVKHGIKMSAMPAFGRTHADATIWNIAAFVKQLPAMTPETYRAIEAEHEEGGHGGGAHEASGQESAA